MNNSGDMIYVGNMGNMGNSGDIIYVDDISNVGNMVNAGNISNSGNMSNAAAVSDANGMGDNGEKEITKRLRKSEFRNYIMVNKLASGNIIKLGSEQPNALKLFMYMCMYMDKANTIKEFRSKDFQDAFNFDGRKITSASVAKYRDKLVEIGFIDYKAQSGNYVVNPYIVWSTYSDKRKHCKFDDNADKLYRKYVEKNKGKINEKGVTSYYTINRNYKSDLFWISQQDNRALHVLFYLFSAADDYNLVPVKKASMKTMCEKLGLKRQAVSRTINLLSGYNFICIRKDGRNNEYIINPELFWSSNKDNIRHCKFPISMTINTPARRQYVVSQEETKDYEEIADIVMRYIKDNNMEDICGNTEVKKVTFRRELVRELNIIDNSCESSVLIDFIQGMRSVVKERESVGS